VGCAARRARAIDGVAGVVVNIGGDIQHMGDRAVTVGIADPCAPAENAPPIAAVRLANAGLATSGGYRRGFTLNGRRVSHIVDPRTGEPADRIASASVFAPDCATADALSTAFSVMEPSESVALADAMPGVGCLLIERDGSCTTNAAWNAAALAPRTDFANPRT
jgi:thiamine biosynthesis lipoprotein